MFISDKKFILAILLFLLAGQFTWNGIPGFVENFRWFDKVQHFLGGFLVCSIFLLLIKEYPQLLVFPKNPFVALVLVISFVALIGVGWELYEYFTDYFYRNFLHFSIPLIQSNLDDTMEDLIFDLLGGLTGTLIFLKTRRKD